MDRPDIKQTSITCLVSDSVITELVNHSHASSSLDDAAHELFIIACAEDDHTLHAAMKAAALKTRLLAGEAGMGVKWMEWMKVRIPLSTAHLYALVKIGSADNPIKALDDWRRDNRNRSKDRGLAKKSKLSENHRLLMKAISKLSDAQAKDEYVRFYQRHRALCAG